jgi:hypothetical protein
VIAGETVWEWAGEGVPLPRGAWRQGSYGYDRCPYGAVDRTCQHGWVPAHGRLHFQHAGCGRRVVDGRLGVGGG